MKKIAKNSITKIFKFIINNINSKHHKKYKVTRVIDYEPIIGIHNNKPHCILKTGTVISVGRNYTRLIFMRTNIDKIKVSRYFRYKKFKIEYGVDLKEIGRTNKELFNK
jgi:hypothetical protein